VCPAAGLRGYAGVRRGRPARADCLQAAQADSRDDRRAAGQLGGTERVGEQHRSGDRADQRLEVDKRSCYVGAHPALAEGEQCCRRHGAGQYQRAGGQQRGRTRVAGRPALGEQRHRQRERSGGQQLYGAHGHRVAVAQYPGLGHHEGRGYQLRGEHQAVPVQRGAAALACRDDRHPAQRQREASPGHGTGHAVPGDCRDYRHERWHRADQQGGMRDAGVLHADVLQHDGKAVAGSAGNQDGRAHGSSQPRRAPDHHHQDRGCQAEPAAGEPGRRQPGQGQLGQRHGSAPQQAGRDERGEGETTAGHASMSAADRPRF